MSGSVFSDSVISYNEISSIIKKALESSEENKIEVTIKKIDRTSIHNVTNHYKVQDNLNNNKG